MKACSRVVSSSTIRKALFSSATAPASNYSKTSSSAEAQKAVYGKSAKWQSPQLEIRDRIVSTQGTAGLNKTHEETNICSECTETILRREARLLLKILLGAVALYGLGTMDLMGKESSLKSIVGLSKAARARGIEASAILPGKPEDAPNPIRADKLTHKHVGDTEGTTVYVSDANTLSASSKVTIVADPDGEYEPEIAAKYREDLAERQLLESLGEEHPDDVEEEKPAKPLPWIFRLVKLLIQPGDDMGAQFVERSEEKRRKKKLASAKLIAPRVTCRRVIGVKQLFQSNEMEDRYVFDFIKFHDRKMLLAAVIDGAHGSYAADYIRSELTKTITSHLSASPVYLLRESFETAFQELEQNLLKRAQGAGEIGLADAVKTGAAVVVALIDPSCLVIANVGHTKAVLGRKGRAYCLHRWHSANELREQRLLLKYCDREDDTLKCKHVYETERQIHTIWQWPLYVTGRLGIDTVHTDCLVKGLAPAVRSLGHFQLKDPQYKHLFKELIGAQKFPYMSPIPSLRVFPRTSADDFLILGSGGFWQYVADSEAVLVVEAALDALVAENVPDAERNYAQAAADALVRAATENWLAKKGREQTFQDRPDFTAVVIPLNRGLGPSHPRQVTKKRARTVSIAEPAVTAAPSQLETIAGLEFAPGQQATWDKLELLGPVASRYSENKQIGFLRWNLWHRWVRTVRESIERRADWETKWTWGLSDGFNVTTHLNPRIS